MHTAAKAQARFYPSGVLCWMTPWPQSLHRPVEMNKAILLSLLCLCFGSLSALATPFDEANQRFKSGDFAGAVAAYETILKQDGPRASVYFNLGNSYQSLKKFGPAILAYERARLLTPRDPDLLANLALARKAVAITEDTRIHPWLDAVIRYLSRNEWSWTLAGAAFFLGGLGLVCGIARVPSKFSISSAAFATLILMTCAGVLYLRRGESSQGIVLSESAAVRLSPFEKAESVGTAGQGRVVRMGEKNGDFQYIEVPGSSLLGWLNTKEIGAISQ
jgi:tetratricopeptide (TPR) repeat protein